MFDVFYCLLLHAFGLFTVDHLAGNEERRSGSARVVLTSLLLIQTVLFQVLH
jgi:hypothetical protein